MPFLAQKEARELPCVLFELMALFGVLAIFTFQAGVVLICQRLPVEVSVELTAV